MNIRRFVIRLPQLRNSKSRRTRFGGAIINSLFAVSCFVFVLMLSGQTANAADYYSTYGQSRAWNVTLSAAGTRNFEVDGIAQYKTTYWFVNGVYKETDSSGIFAYDPDYSWSFSSGTTDIQADVYNSDGSFKEYHLWHVSVQTIISAYWLTPVYVTEGTVVTMRAQVTGFSVGDQFAFEIREDDYPLSSDYVTTKYGNVYSSGGNLYVDATWTSAWQSDQSGDPEFYLIASRGSISKESSRADANEMHVARGPVLSRSPSSLSQTITQGQNAPSQSFEVWNSGGGTLSYSISDNATWLSASPGSGTSTGEHDSITVTYSTTGLVAGTYNATITISASGASGSPQTVAVTLTVNPPPQTLISAYWLTPVYVTEGAVVTMRAQVSGYNVGDQFAFEIREDDGVLGYDYVTTKYGNVYSSGGNYYVDATWTTLWQSDQSGDPEFYFVVSRGGASLSSSTSDANEMHVARGPVLSLNLSSLSPSATQGQNAASQSFEVWNSGGGTLSYSISDDASWLSVSPSSGTSTGEHDTITVNYSTAGLGVGTYNATITVTASGASGSPQTVGVTLTVNPPPFAPYFQDARITGKTDLDGDGYARQFNVEFNVDANVSGQYYVKIYEYDGGFGLDDYLTQSSTFTVNGTATDYQTKTIVCDNYPGFDLLSHGTAEIKLELYNAANNALMQTWTPNEDADLGNVLVELSSEDSLPVDADDQISEAVSLGAMDQTRTSSPSTAIDLSTDVDMYSFSVSAGQRISFDIDLPSGSLAPYLRVFDAGGNELAHNAGAAGPVESTGTEAYLEYTFSSAGTFYVGVSGVGNNSYNAVNGTGDGTGSTGAYMLVVSPGIAGTARVNGVSTDYLVDIMRIDQKAIDPSKRTWIVIHGRNSSRTNENIADVAASIASTRPTDQVLTLDWRGAASYPGIAGYGGEDAIQNVGIWAAAALQEKGFVGANLNLVGHSWGSYVADELAERIPGGVDTITALDAAENVPGGYSPETPGEIDFARDSDFSWAFHSDGIAGSNVTPPTADEAFIVDNSNHGNVVFLFAYMLMHPNDAVGQFFLLLNLLLGQVGPWMPNQYVSQLPIGLGLTEDPVGGYEADILADNTGRVPVSISYVPMPPEISVLGNGVQIADGDTTPSSIDGTDFGAVLQGQSGPTRTFVVKNDGGSTLTIGTISLPSGFSLVGPQPTSVALSQSASFTVGLNTTVAGPFSGQISFSNNDGNENPFNFTISGTVTALPAVATPTITPNGGVFVDSVQVSLACATSAAALRFTTNGSDPTITSALYTVPFTLSTSGTVKAKAFKSGYNDSAVASASFAISTSAQPILGMTRLGNNVILQWPTNAVGFALEYSTNLPAVSWTPASPAPVIVNGQYTVTNTISGSRKFYRLRK